MIELATGIHASKYLVSDGSYIVICDHFFGKFKKKDKKNKDKIKTTAHGIQLVLDGPLLTLKGDQNMRDALKR